MYLYNYQREAVSKLSCILSGLNSDFVPKVWVDFAALSKGLTFNIVSLGCLLISFWTIDVIISSNLFIKASHPVLQ